MSTPLPLSTSQEVMEVCDRLPWEECALSTDLLLNMNLREIKTAMICDEFPPKNDFIDSELEIKLLIISDDAVVTSLGVGGVLLLQKTPTETQVLNDSLATMSQLVVIIFNRIDGITGFFSTHNLGFSRIFLCALSTSII